MGYAAEAPDVRASIEAEAHAYGRAAASRSRVKALAKPHGRRQPFTTTDLDRYVGTSPEQRKRAAAAIHEAGHVVLMRAFGYGALKAKIYENGNGWCSGVPPTRRTTDARYVALIHALGGPLAEAVAGEPYPTPKERSRWAEEFMRTSDTFRSPSQHPELACDDFHVGELVLEDMAAAYEGSPDLEADGPLNRAAYRKYLVDEATADAADLLAQSWSGVINLAMDLAERESVVL